jgi:mono/diheme cytochrome c family protein
MRKRAIAGVLVLVGAIGAIATAQSGGTAAPAKPSGSVARGKYLVNNVGKCDDCHTPMDKKGQPIMSQRLQGAPLMFKPTVPVPGWMAVAPGIAGLPGLTEEQAIQFFTTGKKPDGSMAAPPMPAFRFNKADAAAVTSYLKSLKAQ